MDICKSCRVKQSMIAQFIQVSCCKRSPMLTHWLARRQHPQNVASHHPASAGGLLTDSHLRQLESLLPACDHPAKEMPLSDEHGSFLLYSILSCSTRYQRLDLRLALLVDHSLLTHVHNILARQASWQIACLEVYHKLVLFLLIGLEGTVELQSTCRQMLGPELLQAKPCHREDATTIPAASWECRHVNVFL